MRSAADAVLYSAKLWEHPGPGSCARRGGLLTEGQPGMVLWAGEPAGQPASSVRSWTPG
jgi:hypothetical protein